ncbi:uncharacterized protein LOC136042613 [Artemia franciscana]|uniref:uncharacterized protein LOC136042613 n=1 Tax=Artemia franciscana TaxID=6661 RepID=UPI0032DB9A54
MYIRSKLEYGIQFLTNIPVTLFNTLETLQNSAIRIALGLHKHTAVVKLKELSGLTALKDRATMQRNCYFTKIQTYGKTHAVFPSTFGNPAKPQHLLSSFSQYLKDYPNWKNEQADSYPFPKSPPWEMVAPECHLQLVSKDKSHYSDQYVCQLFANKISSHFPEHILAFTDGSVKGSRAGAGVCIPHVSLNISATFPSHISILSAELFAIHKALETMAILNLSSKNVLILTDSNSAIQLIRKINYEAADSDLKLIRDDLQRLNKCGIFVCFQYIPGHKGLIHNVTADRLANEAANIDPQPESKLGNLRDIMKRRGQIKCLPFRNSPFRSREDTVWYYRLKSGYLFLNSVRFQWNLYHSPL